MTSHLLFKYCNPERIDILKNGRIRLTQPICFNDVYEANPVAAEGIWNLDIDDSEKAKLWDYFQQTPFLKIESPDAISKAMVCESLLNKAKNRISNIIGVLSLTETHDNILMWTHYSQNFQGFVIGMRSDDLPFTWKQSKEPFALRRVRYSETRPSLSINEIMDENIDGELLYKWLATKSKDWSYENEWRIIKYLLDSDNIIPTSTYPIHLAPVDLQKIECVIIGSRASLTLKNDIINICEQYNIKVLYQFRSTSSYTLGLWDKNDLHKKHHSFHGAGKQDIGFKNI